MRKPKKTTTENKPEPMVFEHVPAERRYDRIANRVLAAISELNKSLEEAHECAEMRVFIGAFKADGHAMRFEPQIYNLTHSHITFTIKVREDGDPEPAMAWRHVKDPTFKDAAGQGLNKFKAAGK